MHTKHLLSGLLVATLVVPLSVFAESDNDRAKREVDAFCKTVPLYCSKLSKAEKQAMLKRFKDESPHATPLHVPAPNVVAAPRTPAAATPRTNEYGLQTQTADPVTNTVNRMVTDCARAAGIGKTINTQQMLTLTDCVDRRTGQTR